MGTFRQYFSEDEVTVYATLSAAIVGVQNKEEFDEFMDILGEMNEEQLKRLLMLGVLMGAYLVQQSIAAAEQAKSN